MYCKGDNHSNGLAGSRCHQASIRVALQNHHGAGNSAGHQQEEKQHTLSSTPYLSHMHKCKRWEGIMFRSNSTRF